MAQGMAERMAGRMARVWHKALGLSDLIAFLRGGAARGLDTHPTQSSINP